MICVDKTFLVDLWRTKDLFDSTPRDVLNEHADEELVVPLHAAGGFLECGAAISTKRLEESLQLLSLFRIGEVGIETACRYAEIVATQRVNSALVRRPKTDLWVAAWAIEHDAPLLTRDTWHFRDIPGLRLIGYDDD